MRNRRITAILAILAVTTAVANGQISQPSSSSSSFGTMPNNSGFQQNSPLGSGGSFRPNNSSFGSALGISTPSAGTGTNPFEEARVDPQAQGRAGTGETTGARTQRNQQGRNQQGRNGQRAQGSNGARGQGNNAFGQGQLGRQGQMRGIGTSSRPPQVVMRIDFRPEVVPSETIVTAARSSLGRESLPGMDGLEIRYTEGIAVLDGQVRTAREARLAAAILSLEPGVRSIDNRLVVRPDE